MEFIANQPRMVQNIMHVHVDDGTGHCRSCIDRGVRPVWPCTLIGLALQARALRRQ